MLYFIYFLLHRRSREKQLFRVVAFLFIMSMLLFLCCQYLLSVIKQDIRLFMNENFFFVCKKKKKKRVLATGVILSSSLRSGPDYGFSARKKKKKTNWCSPATNYFLWRDKNKCIHLFVFIASLFDGYSRLQGVCGNHQIKWCFRRQIAC